VLIGHTSELSQFTFLSLSLCLSSLSPSILSSLPPSLCSLFPPSLYPLFPPSLYPLFPSSFLLPCPLSLSLATQTSEVCHASVVFGVAKDYYMTETIESNNPEWNEEAHM